MEKVVFLLKAREFGGMEVILLDWLSRIDCSITSVAVCSYGTPTLWERIASLGLPIETVPLTISDEEPFWKVSSKWLGLFSSIRADKIVILEGFIGEIGLTPLMAARWRNRQGRTLLYETNWGRSLFPDSATTRRKLHFGFLPGVGLYRYRELVKQRVRGTLAHHTFVMSQGIKDNLVSQYGYPADRTSVLHHGVDTRRFQASTTVRLDFRRANGIPEDAKVMVCHGRLVPRKRVDRILQAFEVLSVEQTNLWLLLTCYGPLKEEVERMAAASAASGRIKLVGFQQDSTAVLKASDIYVLSSNDEGFGIAVVEALSTGLVCVATDGPGPRDIIADGQNGFLVDASNDGVLLGLRRALALHADERVRLVQQARKTVEDRFEIGAAIRAALDAMKIPRR
jgi:glycosyltransferase involved in cell wall biosynthesis